MSTEPGLSNEDAIKKLDEDVFALIPKWGLTLVLASMIRFVERHVERVKGWKPDHPDNAYLAELLTNLRHTYTAYCKRYG